MASTPTPPSFDLIAIVGHAYSKTWAERHYLLRMALIPLLVKYVSYALSVQMIEPDNILRLTLFMLPAYFVEGWLLAHWARTLLLNHRWPFRPTGDDRADNAELTLRGRGVLGGAIAFTLINVLMGGYFAYFISQIPLDMDPANADPKVALIGVFMMVSSFLLFRFVWSYIALSINYPLKAYLRRVQKLSVTFQMMGVWLVCFIPPVITLQFLGGALLSMKPEGVEAFGPLDALITFLRISLDMVKNVLVTAGLAYAFISILGLKRQK